MEFIGIKMISNVDLMLTYKTIMLELLYYWQIYHSLVFKLYSYGFTNTTQILVVTQMSLNFFLILKI